ncbi:hypothetical protein PIB30_114855, partial [Stylosanthes scabra]|nr:hypothetical protein [Stylosanthes scabra]
MHHPEPETAEPPETTTSNNPPMGPDPGPPRLSMSARVVNPISHATIDMSWETTCHPLAHPAHATSQCSKGDGDSSAPRRTV